MNTHNFYAGPAILPKQVFKKAADSILNFNGLGLSILEISHRSKDFVAVMDKTRALVKELLQIPDERIFFYIHYLVFCSSITSSIYCDDCAETT